MNTNLKIVSFGEVLFDVFGNEKKVGGAPLNVALRVASFGFPSGIISAVGNDENGRELLNFIKENNLPTSAVLCNTEHPTGVVQVTLNDKGSATYEICYPSAWDFIEMTDEVKEELRDADVLVYGSLVSRDSTSRNTLHSILQHYPKLYKVMDVNLRKPHYTYDNLLELMQSADFIKLNDEEVLELAEAYGGTANSLEEAITFLARKTNADAVCVTRGKHGSILYWENQFYYHDGYEVKVADTVGAGDSFLAALLTKLLVNKNPQEALDFASAVGALVATYTGANPKISITEIENFLKTEPKL